MLEIVKNTIVNNNKDENTKCFHIKSLGFLISDKELIC